MFNSNPSKNMLLTELSNGNVELGEAFAFDIENMTRVPGKINENAQDIEIIPKSWKTLANKPDKTPDEIAKLDKQLISAIYEYAESYLLFIAKKTGNIDGKITYDQYEKYILENRFAKLDWLNRPDYLQKVKEKIKNAFDKLSSHGQEKGDNLIDKDDIASFIYALLNIVKRDENNKLTGFEINGRINPQEYLLNEFLLYEKEDNLMSLKMRIGYKFMKGEL